MGWMREWVWQIAGIIILSSVCDMIIPGGQMKKYVRSVMGIILVIAVVRPLAGICPLKAEEIHIKDKMHTAVELKNNLEGRELFNIVRLYKEKICEKMKKILMESEQINADVKVEICEEDKDFGAITRMTVLVYPAEAESVSFERIKQIIEKETGVVPERIKVVLLKE